MSEKYDLLIRYWLKNQINEIIDNECLDVMEVQEMCNDILNDFNTLRNKIINDYDELNLDLIEKEIQII